MKKYILDTNVYIEAYKGYYHPDIVPVYWEILKDLGKKNIISSPKQVREEIKIQNTPSKDKNGNASEVDRFLFDWSRSNNSCFLKQDLVGIEAFFLQVQRAYEKVKQVNDGILRTKDRKYKWGFKTPVSDEDMFVIATVLFYKKHVPANEYILVTKEGYDMPPKRYKPMKIPHLCKELDIKWINDFDFIKDVGIKFENSNYSKNS